MSATHADSLTEGYLARLKEAAGDLPKTARAELVDDMRSHIAEARAREPEETDAAILNILDRLGDPAGVVADARERLGIPPSAPPSRGLLEIAAVFLVVLAWPVGVVLLWSSPAWNRRDKLIGSLAPLVTYIGLFGSGIGICNGQANICGGGSDWPGIVGTLTTIVLFGVALFTMLYLAIRLRMSRQRRIAAT